VAPGNVEVWSRRVGSVHCEKGQAKGIIGCARAREEEQARRGGTGSPGGVAIVDQGQRQLQTPVRNPFGARQRLREGAKGDGGGVMGLLIAAVRRRLRQEIKCIEGESNGGEETVSGEIFGPGRKKTDTRGPHVGEWEREGCTGSGVFSFLGCGLDPLLGRNGAPGPYLIFISFSSFSFFCFSYSFSRFCILNPNQAKPIS
jgi:hypothetical protein